MAKLKKSTNVFISYAGDDAPRLVVKKEDRGVILLSGCMNDQLSLDGANNGLFTANLKKVWHNGAFDGGTGCFTRPREPHAPSPRIYSRWAR
jgi:hypothetical protein